MFYLRKAFILTILVVFLYSCRHSATEINTIISTDSDSTTAGENSNREFLYGIPPDSFDLVNGHIKPNGFLSDILVSHGVTMTDIDQVVRNGRSVFDVRSMRAGNDYILFCDRDSAARARYLVYEHDATTCYVFSFTDSLSITQYRKKITSEIKYASGTIETSLWDAMIGGGLHPSLAISLSEIFAWTVDFFGLQKGDNFKVIYEDLSIDGKQLRTGRIYGAQFSRSGSVITAIPFVQDSTESYFDVDGSSLKKAFLKAPLQFSRISSHFSSSRLHPILRIRRPHYGVDYAAPVGTPVHAIGDGRVTAAKTENGSGKMVRIQHNSVYATAYLHLSRFGQGIAPGAFVKQGDIIGYVGTTGLSTGPHLDFRFYRNGSPVDPLKVEAPPVEPVSPDNLEKFEKIKMVILSLLGTID